VKYKHLPSMGHNFAYSFVSLMNYVDTEHVVDELRTILRQSEQHELIINFLTGAVVPASVESPLLRQSIANYRHWLPIHAASHNVDMAHIKQLDIHLSGGHEKCDCVVHMTDDREKTYRIRLKEW